MNIGVSYDDLSLADGYTMGITELASFSRKILMTLNWHGRMDINVCGISEIGKQAYGMLKLFGMPFRT